MAMPPSKRPRCDQPHGEHADADDDVDGDVPSRDIPGSVGNAVPGTDPGIAVDAAKISLDALHVLILKHLEESGVRTDLVQSLRTELHAGKFNYTVESCLYKVFRYAREHVVEVSVAGLAGVLGTVEVKAASLVHTLQANIETLTNTPVREQRLLHQGSELKPAECLAARGISPLSASITIVRVIPEVLYIIGGMDDEDKSVPSLEVFNRSTCTWTPLPPMAWLGQVWLQLQWMASYMPSAVVLCLLTRTLGTSLSLSCRWLWPRFLTRELECGIHCRPWPRPGPLSLRLR